jgi:phosphoglycerol transferase
MAVGTRRRTLRGRSLAAWLPASLAAGGSLVLAMLLLKVWHADFQSPFSYERDALQNLMLIKNTLEQGWPLHNPLLGAPFGQELYDFPVVAGDVTHLLIIKLIGLFSSNPAVVMNVFFLVQFPITALAALWVLRRLGVATWPAVACATLFALAPYHFYRGELHVFLAGYWSVPLGLFLVFSLLLDKRIAWPALVVVSVIIGTSEVYYAVFTLLLLAVALGVALFRPTRRQALVTGVAAAAIIGATLAAAHAPTIVYHAKHGQNSEIQKSRNPQQSEIFGMRLARVVLPVDQHRIGPLADVTKKYNDEAPSQLDDGPPQALGTIATLGLLSLLVIVALALAPGAIRRPLPPLLPAAGIVVLAATLIGVVGGFSGVISYLISHTVRSWNRYSIYIGFAALVPIALAMTQARVRMTARGMGPVVLGVALTAVVVLGALDQTGRGVVPRYDQLSAQWKSEAAFVRDVEAKLPRGADVYETPYVPFPESGYEPARPYFHSSTLHWSFGAMVGRPEDWARALLGQPGEVIVPSVAAAGFAGVYLDRGLYPDGGTAAAADLGRMLGQPLVRSATTRFELYDLRPYAQRVLSTLGPQAKRLGDLTLHPPRAEFGPGFGPASIDPGEVYAVDNRRMCSASETWIDLYNPSAQPRNARMQTDVAGLRDGHLRFTFPDGQSASLSIAPSPKAFDRVIALRPGRNRIRVTTDIRPDQTHPDLFGFQRFRVIGEDARLLALEAARGA